MEFTSFLYLGFLALVLPVHWLLPRLSWRNLWLVGASYLFYGWVHPWFCLLIFFSTLLDYGCALGMERCPLWKRWFLSASLAGNLGLLATFKYFNFFLGNLQAVGVASQWRGLQLMLPVGISFYTFQTLSYTLDVYRGHIRARSSFLNFALFVSFFPQLVAGPIERAAHLLPQLETQHRFHWTWVTKALPLLLLGYFKKLVVADNIAPWVDQVFLLQHPSLNLLFMGSLGFAIQIFADFSAYTDIARATAQLLGVNLMENFKAPFLAHSPSDFWKRWHLSFSSWIRDYLYIPLGGSRTESSWRQAAILTATMGLSGLWHGAAWNFVAWGLFHALLLFSYRQLGCGGRWNPQGLLSRGMAWGVFQFFSVCAWTLFRTPDLSWLWNILRHPTLDFRGPDGLACVFLALVFLAYSLLWLLHFLLERRGAHSPSWAVTAWQWAALSALALLANRLPQQFIYFQF